MDTPTYGYFSVENDGRRTHIVSICIDTIFCLDKYLIMERVAV